MPECGTPKQTHREPRGGLAPGHALLETVGTRNCSHCPHRDSQETFVLIALFKCRLLVQCVGDRVFVATANDRATEKGCLFLELSFSLKEIKINIESFCFF